MYTTSSSSRNCSNFLLIITLILLAGLPPIQSSTTRFRIKEATVRGIRHAFEQKKLTSRQLTKLYLGEIKKLNPVLKGVIEVNPDALAQADVADRERLSAKPSSSSLPGLHGIPILLKDNIGTKDKLNTTAGSFALLGSVVPRDAGVVARLRKSGAVILGKASMSEWAEFRSLTAPSGWSARGGQAKNPYVLSADPCGSSSGSSISVAANMVAVSLGTETDGSILCPASANSVVGIKPTVGLTSRAGVIPITPRQDTVGYVIPITPRQDTVGPICRTVADAVYVLDAITGFDQNDANATRQASRYIPIGGYTQFLRKTGLRGKRIGIVRDPFFNFTQSPIFNQHFQTLREEGAVVVDNLKIDNIDAVLNVNLSGEAFASIAEFKIAVNEYLQNLVASPVRSLADVIAFNQDNPNLEMLKEFGQDVFLLAESTSGIGITEQAAIVNMGELTRDGFKKVMKRNRLDAIVTPGSSISPVLAIGGFPGISIPAGYDATQGVPFGICFAGLKGSEPSLIEIAYAFEQATNIRKPPSFHP